MKVHCVCLLLLLVAVTIGLGSARKGKKKKDRKSAPQWKTSSMPYLNERFETALEGEELDLDCKSQGKPKPSVTWFKDGVKVKEKTKIELKKAGVLKLRDMTTDMSGNYTCLVRNNQGELNWTFHLDVRVKVWPLVVEGPNNITQMAGSNVAFRCRVLNDPKATIRWQRVRLTHDEQNPPEFLPDGDDPQILTLENIQKEDEGEYRCMAGNVHGLKHSKAWLTVIENVLVPDLSKMDLDKGRTKLTDGYDPVASSDNTNTDSKSPFFIDRDADPSDLGPFEFGPDLYYTTTRRPRNRNNGERRKNGRKKNRKGDKGNKSSDRGKSRTTTFETTTTTSTTTSTQPPILSSYPEIWNFDDEDDHFDGISDTRYKPNRDNEDNKSETVKTGSAKSEDDGEQKGSISSWTIYTIVGAIGGVILLIGLIAITLTLCCKREEGGVYKSTPV